MNNQFIQRVIFDWDKIDKDSYLKEIRAFKGVEKLDFNKPITLILRVERRIMFFLRMIHIWYPAVIPMIRQSVRNMQNIRTCRININHSYVKEKRSTNFLRNQ